MPTFEDARQIIISSVAPFGVERVYLLESLGRITAENVAAPWNMPRYDNSAMDGYAVRSADCQPTNDLQITDYIPAGKSATKPVDPGCAIKIMTGAPIPANCDAVVPFEESAETNGRVQVKRSVVPGQHIRLTGEDVRCGEIFLPAGRLIRPPEINMLASFGNAFVSVYRRPRVAILSTGDELVELGEPLAVGQIINSNALSLAASVMKIGAIPVLLGIARDNSESHRKLLAEGLNADAMITSAGVSMGDRDFVRQTLEELGVKQLFWRVDVKPGGPTAFGMKDGKPVFSLPGNPVATMIIFEELVRPALLKMMGHKHPIKPFMSAVLQHEVRKKAGKTNFLRVRLSIADGKYLAFDPGDQNTGMLKTTLLANAIAVLPAERTSFSLGDEVDVHILSSNIGMLEPK
jgi:molybdopterin molybdotransferase